MLDHELRNATSINGHPLTNERTICVSPDGVQVFLELVNHPPQWIDFSTAE